MVDATISADQTGLYEQPLAANTIYVVALNGRYTNTAERVEIINHGTTPLYIRVGTTVALRDPAARIIGPGNFLENVALPQTAAPTIAVISSTDSSFSISRT